MTDIGSYTFLPWLRQGIANRIDADDMDHAVESRATIDVRLRVTAEPLEGETPLQQDIQQEVELYGPGDIVGIEAAAIVKVEPRNWITNFEPNYLPYIEFYDEDFPWRYTPAAPSAANRSRLRPWIALVVLTEDEFEEGAAAVPGRPLSFVEISDSAVFPAAADLWAWAHVHVNRSLVPGDPVVAPEGDTDAVLDGLEATLAENADLAYSRIVSPRMLAANTAYHAFLMPVFESGRRVGLGLEPDGTPFATHGAWEPYPNPADRPDATSYPFYHRWYFRTGTVGDFEFLVRLLVPQPMDVRVGRRDMDVQKPGSGLPGIADQDLGGVLRLGGALQVPLAAQDESEQETAQTYENWDQPYPHEFQTWLAAFVNLAETYQRLEAEQAKQDPNLPDDIRDDPDPDPLVTPPIYGRWHAKTPRLLTDPDGDPLPDHENWVHELNLDPRFRVPAGFGSDVVRANQESYMDAAWKQVGEVLAANQRIRWAQIAKEVSHVWHADHLSTLHAVSPGKFLGLTAPVDSRVLLSTGGAIAQRATRLHLVRTSIVPRAAVSAPLRRIIRPRSRIVERLGFTDDLRPEMLAGRINDEEVFPAPPKAVPEALPTRTDLAEAMEPDAPAFLIRVLRRWPWLPGLALALAVVALVVGLLLGGPWIVVGIVLAAALTGGWWYLRQLAGRLRAADSVRPENQTPGAVDRMPSSPDFRLAGIGEDFRPRRGRTDSVEATRFKTGLRDAYGLVNASRAAAAEPVRRPIDLTVAVQGTLEALDPEITIPRHTFGGIYLPPRIVDGLVAGFDEAMAYPEIDLPMYKPLADLSSELLLPNLHLVAQNSISLLETNQRFIEAYMVGLNHEFARELLWREYPTDQRGSYFRQFWDVSTFLDPATDPSDSAAADALREKLRDIPPLHRWLPSSELGDHDNRELPGENEDELVLVIRGELLKKYPTAVIYAHRAEWTLDDAGEIDRSQPRRLTPLTQDEADKPPFSKVRTPLYEAKVDPDIYFFGFDLTTEEASGETEEAPDDPGWFFVIKERPGEPRFGFDLAQDGTTGGVKRFWNDVSWDDVRPGASPGDFVLPTAPPSISLIPPPSSATPEEQAQHEEDVQVRWDSTVSAAELAYIMYQVPVLVAVHASKMLPE